MALRDANILQDFTVWVAGNGKIGESPGYQPPEIKVQTEEFRGGGMDGTVDIPMGVEKIEFDFDLHTWDTDVWSVLGFGNSLNAVGQTAIQSTLSVPIHFRGYLITPSGANRGVLIETSSLVREIKINKVEPGKKTEMTVSCTASKFKHTVGGKVITEIDIFNKVFKVNGVDRNDDARRHLGFTY
jgi:P2 family phage contractile tail tube protein